jgi:hypothetical protein
MSYLANKSSKNQFELNGRLLFELKDGRLSLYPLTDSDEETEILIAAISKRMSRELTVSE